MALNPLLGGLDNVERAGRYFVDLTRRLENGELDAGEDATRLSRALGLTVPSELANASIVSLKEEASEVAEASVAAPRTRIVIEYPPAPDPCPGQIARTFKKCFRVCQTVAGAKVCAEVCVNISIGLSGIGGEVKATVSVSF